MDTVIKDSYLHSELTDTIIKCFYRVYSELCYGFLESVYENALVIELRNNGLKVASQVPIEVFYQGKNVGNFIAEIIVDEKVLLELKAARSLEPIMEAQVLNYLRATPIELGLLLNFGKKPQIKRLLFDNPRKGMT